MHTTNESVLSMAEAQYRKAEGISKSDLDYIAPPRTPAHFKALKDGLMPKVESPAMRMGSIIHRAVLEPDTMEGAYSVRPEKLDLRTAEGREWKTAQGEKEILTAAEWSTVIGVRDSVWAHPYAKRILKDAQTEMCLFAEDDGIVRKARLDALVGGSAIPDLKTAGSADPMEFERSLGRFRYHVQAAYYIDLCRLIGIPKDQFLFIVVEKEPPYAVAVYSLDQDAIDLGRMEYKRDLGMVKDCLEKGVWPSFTTDITVVSLPEYIRKQVEGLL